MKINKFLKLGFVSLVGSLVIGNSAFAHEEHEPINQQAMEQIVHNNSDKAENNFINNFVAKYQLDTKNIHIKAIRFDKNLPIAWNQSTALQNNDGSQDIILILDKKGDLYNIDKDFTGNIKLTQQEKDLLKEQTLLHEYMHAYIKRDTNLFQSTKLSTSENTAMNDVFFKNLPNLAVKSVYNESQAAFSANELLIKYNGDNIPLVKSLITKMTKGEVLRGNNYWDKFQAFETHIMMPEGGKIILNDLNNNPDFLRGASFDNMLSYSKQVASDLSLDYLAKYGNYFKLSEDFENIKFVRDSLFNTIKDIAQPENVKLSSASLPFIVKAKEMIEKYPQLKTPQGLGTSSSYDMNKSKEIIFKESKTDYAFVQEVMLARKFGTSEEKQAFEDLLVKNAQELSNQSNFVLAKKIANDYIQKSSLDLVKDEALSRQQEKVKVSYSSVINKVKKLRQDIQEKSANNQADYKYKM